MIEVMEKDGSIEKEKWIVAKALVEVVGCSLVVKYMHEALSSIPSIKNVKKNIYK
jgi:hypothetical protein